MQILKFQNFKHVEDSALELSTIGYSCTQNNTLHVLQRTIGPCTYLLRPTLYIFIWQSCVLYIFILCRAKAKRQVLVHTGSSSTSALCLNRQSCDLLALQDEHNILTLSANINLFKKGEKSSPEGHYKAGKNKFYIRGCHLHLQMKLLF